MKHKVDKIGVLFFFSENKLAFDQISLALFLKKSKIKVIFLLPKNRGPLHEYLEKNKVNMVYFKKDKSTLKTSISKLNSLFKVIFKENIEVVFSQLPLDNLITAVLHKVLFRSLKLITVRHHVDYILKGKNQNAKIIDCFVNKLSPKIQIISDKSFNHMVCVEKVKDVKLLRLNPLFNFELFPKINKEKVSRIRESFNADYLLISIGRFIPIKNHLKTLDILKLISPSINWKFLLLGEGTLKNEIEERIKQNEIQDKVFLTGYVINQFDYLKASDLVIHLSSSENSSGVLKESAITKTPFLGYYSVGDNSQFLNPQTGYGIPKNATNEAIAKKIEEALFDNERKIKAKKLKERIIDAFSGENLEKTYLELIQ